MNDCIFFFISNLNHSCELQAYTSYVSSLISDRGRQSNMTKLAIWISPKPFLFILFSVSVNDNCLPLNVNVSIHLILQNEIHVNYLPLFPPSCCPPHIPSSPQISSLTVCWMALGHCYLHWPPACCHLRAFAFAFLPGKVLLPLSAHLNSRVCSSIAFSKSLPCAPIQNSILPSTPFTYLYFYLIALTTSWLCMYLCHSLAT